MVYSRIPRPVSVQHQPTTAVGQRARPASRLSSITLSRSSSSLSVRSVSALGFRTHEVPGVLCVREDDHVLADDSQISVLDSSWQLGDETFTFDRIYSSVSGSFSLDDYLDVFLRAKVQVALDAPGKSSSFRLVLHGSKHVGKSAWLLGPEHGEHDLGLLGRLGQKLISRRLGTQGVGVGADRPLGHHTSILVSATQVAQEVCHDLLDDFGHARPDTRCACAKLYLPQRVTVNPINNKDQDLPGFCIPNLAGVVCHDDDSYRSVMRAIRARRLASGHLTVNIVVYHDSDSLGEVPSLCPPIGTEWVKVLLADLPFGATSNMAFIEMDGSETDKWALQSRRTCTDWLSGGNPAPRQIMDKVLSSIAALHNLHVSFVALPLPLKETARHQQREMLKTVKKISHWDKTRQVRTTEPMSDISKHLPEPWVRVREHKAVTTTSTSTAGPRARARASTIVPSPSPSPSDSDSVANVNYVPSLRPLVDANHIVEALSTLTVQVELLTRRLDDLAPCAHRHGQGQVADDRVRLNDETEDLAQTVRKLGGRGGGGGGGGGGGASALGFDSFDSFIASTPAPAGPLGRTHMAGSTPYARRPTDMDTETETSSPSSPASPTTTTTVQSSSSIADDAALRFSQVSPPPRLALPLYASIAPARSSANESLGLGFCDPDTYQTQPADGNGNGHVSHQAVPSSQTQTRSRTRSPLKTPRRLDWSST